jgi:hypothetical protein
MQTNHTGIAPVNQSIERKCVVYLFMTLEALVTSVAMALEASGVIHSREYGFTCAQGICQSLELNGPPEQEIRVDCRALWLELFKLQERSETSMGEGSYADAARSILGEVLSASVAVGRS